MPASRQYKRRCVWPTLFAFGDKLTSYKGFTRDLQVANCRESFRKLNVA